MTIDGLDSEEPSADPGPSLSSTEADMILEIKRVQDNLGSDDYSGASSLETVIDTLVRRKKRRNQQRYLRHKRMGALRHETREVAAAREPEERMATDPARPSPSGAPTVAGGASAQTPLASSPPST